MYAVTIEPIESIYFLSERPEGERWEAIQKNTKVKVEEGVGIEIPTNVNLWPDGAECPEQVLCRSTSDPKQFKIFKYTREINRNEFVPTGKNFGGAYSAKSWERFLEHLPSRLATLEIPDTDPPGTIEEAIRDLRGAD
jgi:hypothetical protein